MLLYRCPVCQMDVEDRLALLYKHREPDGECDQRMNERKERIERLEKIVALANQGILDAQGTWKFREYARWNVAKPELLPEWLKADYEKYGEIRWY